ncbi:hypothetical protein F01_421199 [Burkholderia cenocepacia]|nr:hypothetical protein F01_421199 [Burkholderia cenocepacia]
MICRLTLPGLGLTGASAVRDRGLAQTFSSEGCAAAQRRERRAGPRPEPFLPRARPRLALPVPAARRRRLAHS